MLIIQRISTICCKIPLMLFLPLQCTTPVHHSSAPLQCTTPVPLSSAPLQCPTPVHHSSAPAPLPDHPHLSSAPQTHLTAAPTAQPPNYPHPPTPPRNHSTRHPPTPPDKKTSKKNLLPHYYAIISTTPFIFSDKRLRFSTLALIPVLRLTQYTIESISLPICKNMGARDPHPSSEPVIRVHEIKGMGKAQKTHGVAWVHSLLTMMSLTSVPAVTGPKVHIAVQFLRFFT